MSDQEMSGSELDELHAARIDALDDFRDHLQEIIDIGHTPASKLRDGDMAKVGPWMGCALQHIPREPWTKAAQATVHYLDLYIEKVKRA